MMRSRALLFGLLFAATVTASCNRFEYSGDEFPPTDSVIVYGEDDSIPKPYSVIGHLSGIKGRFSSMEGLRSAMVKEAARRGADAIAFMAETEQREEERKRYDQSVAGPTERSLTLSRTEKGCWALLIRFR